MLYRINQKISSCVACYLLHNNYIVISIIIHKKVSILSKYRNMFSQLSVAVSACLKKTKIYVLYLHTSLQSLNTIQYEFEYNVKKYSSLSINNSHINIQVSILIYVGMKYRCILIDVLSGIFSMLKGVRGQKIKRIMWNYVLNRS